MTRPAAISVRVSVMDVWDTVPLTFAADTSIAQLKAAALAQATGRRTRPEDYVVKFRGATVENESETLERLHVPGNAAFIVLPARRQPVR